MARTLPAMDETEVTLPRSDINKIIDSLFLMKGTMDRQTPANYIKRTGNESISQCVFMISEHGLFLLLIFYSMCF